MICRKKTRCTPICAIARTTRATGMAGRQTKPRVGSVKEIIVSAVAALIFRIVVTKLMPVSSVPMPEIWTAHR